MNNPFITFLKQVNAMPFPFSMKHYQIFGDATERLKDHELNSAESWDALRESHPFFSIADTREEWLRASEVVVTKDGQDKALPERARDIAALVKEKGFKRIFSAGVGGAALEYQLKKLMPDVPVVCSDYSSVTVERLKKVFTESDDIITFDIVEGDWKSVEERYLGADGLCLLYRLDAGFSDEAWQGIFKAMADAGVRNVLVIPTGMLSFISVYNRKSRELVWWFKRIPVVFSGYVRTKMRFRQQWQKYYKDADCLMAGLKSFLLTRKH